MTLKIIGSIALVAFVVWLFYLIEKYATGKKYKVRYFKDGEWHEEEIECWDDESTTARKYAELYAQGLSETYTITEIPEFEVPK